MTESDFWRDVDCVSVNALPDSAMLGLLPSRATQPANCTYSARSAHLQSFLGLPSASTAAHKRARSGADGARQSTKTKKRKSADSRNTLRAPPVATADALKVKKYPAEHKKRVDAALCDAKVEFCVPASVQSFVARPATKDMGKYWYVLWNAVFALLERDPVQLLPRAAEHVALLYRAQSAVSPLMQEATNNLVHENKASAEERLLCESSVGKENACTADTSAFGSQRAAPIKPLSATSMALPDYAALFCTAARRDVPHYFVDDDVVKALHEVLRNEQPTLASTERFSSAATNADGELLLSLHETCWAFIFGIVERLGDMFLTRACLDRNALQLGLAQRAYWRECARAAGVQVSPDDRPPPPPPLVCSSERAQTGGAPPVRVAAVRDLLYHAFDRLSQPNDTA